MRTRSFALVLLAALAPGAWPQQAPQIVVGPNVQVSKERATQPHYELLGGADPTQPDRLLSCVIIEKQDENRDITVVYRSTDAGTTWSAVLDTKEIRSGDPVCGFAPDGTAFFITMASELPNDERPKLLIYRSTDGGATWGPAQKLPIVDREYLVVDNTKSKYSGRLYIHGTGDIRSLDSEDPRNDIDLFPSVDTGRNWTGPIRRASLGKGWILGTAQGVVLSDGSLALLFGEVTEYAKDSGRKDVDPPAPNHPNSKLKLMLSTDGGDSFESAKVVSDWYFVWPPTSKCCVPWLTADAVTTTFKDRLYATWTDVRSGHAEILLSYSSDKGKSWSKAKVINDEPQAANDAAKRDHFQPVVSVNSEGVVGVMWHDRRDAADNLGWSIRFAASLDGSETFQPSVPVSRVPNTYGPKTPLVTMAAVTGGGTEKSKGGTISLSGNMSGFTFNGGHTVDMPVDSRGVFHPMWVDNRAGLPQVWTATVSVHGSVLLHGDTALAELSDVSDKVTLHVESNSFDREKSTMTVSARLKNASKEALKGPFKVRIVNLRSDLGTPEIANADNGRSASRYGFTSRA